MNISELLYAIIVKIQGANYIKTMKCLTQFESAPCQNGKAITI